MTKVLGKPKIQEFLTHPNPSKKLFGIIMHSGTTNSGHYTCYVRSTCSPESPWYGVNDQVINKIGTFEDMKTKNLSGYEDDIYSIFYT
ncbi:hypothetical protein AaE_002102 [Aphanomyces astaci]|uniref:USP domain-containing protein n=1 Tax=Aphanomyces astaci TaxID=112090 RepID=A0A6A5AAT0_APHAT|nr:hypothetical protein AaE_002102 [Aphanomyces astaci]